MLKQSRLLPLLLALVMLMTVFAACAEKPSDGPVTSVTDVPGTDPVGNTGEETDGTTVKELPIPDTLKFDGRTFRFITAPLSGSNYDEKYLDFEGAPEDTISEAVWRRNIAVEDQLDVVLEVQHADDYYMVVSAIEAMNLDDYPYYDAAYATGINIGPSSAEGNFMDLNRLEYVDFTADYWDANCYEALSMGHRNYMMVSDISMSVYARAHTIIFNQQMLKDVGVEKDPYALVDDNEWTFDKMIEMAKRTARPNGDNVQDENDIYGLYNLNVMGTLASFDFSLTEKDEDDYPKMFQLTDRFHDAFNMLLEVNFNKELHFIPQTMLSVTDYGDWGHMWDWVRGNMFPNDQIAFMYGSFDSVNLLANMAHDYGVVPNPKLTPDQKRYQSMIDQYSNFLCVPITNTDYNFTGAVLEYMAYVSRGTIRNDYIETFLKIKKNRNDDDKMARMVDLIMDSMHYEVSDMFGLGIRDLIDAASDGSLQSKYDGRKSIYQENINDLKQIFASLDELHNADS